MFGHQVVTKLECLREVVTRINMHQRKRKLARTKCFQGEVHQGNAVFPAGKQQAGFSN
jgi:hypothetical protein